MEEAVLYAVIEAMEVNTTVEKEAVDAVMEQGEAYVVVEEAELYAVIEAAEVPAVPEQEEVDAAMKQREVHPRTPSLGRGTLWNLPVSAGNAAFDLANISCAHWSRTSLVSPTCEPVAAALSGTSARLRQPWCCRGLYHPDDSSAEPHCAHHAWLGRPRRQAVVHLRAFAHRAHCCWAPGPEP